MHLHQQGTFYKSCGSKKSSGVTWGHRGQKFMFTKMLLLPHIRCYSHVPHAYGSPRIDTLYKYNVSKNSPGVSWVHREKYSFKDTEPFLLTSLKHTFISNQFLSTPVKHTFTFAQKTRTNADLPQTYFHFQKNIIFFDLRKKIVKEK